MIPGCWDSSAWISPRRSASTSCCSTACSILTAGLLAGTLAIVGILSITTRLILQPGARAAGNSRRRSAKGDLNIRSDINTGDEFQQLSETFNTMLVNLRRAPSNCGRSTRAWI